jgi:phosphotransferase system IIB component
MVKSKSISDVRKIFEKNMTFFSDENIKTYTEMSKKVLFMMEELEKVKPELIKEHNEVLKVLINNYDQQIQNIQNQCNIIDKFLSCLEILDVKPDDIGTLQTITQYKKSLGLI